jgi:hypothetical protein
MERKSHSTSPRIAFWIALIDILLIYFTLHRELPALKIEFQTPFPQVLNQAGMWFKLAEMLFHSAGLIMLFGMISLLIPKLRFVLQFGAGLANLAGVPYLFSLVMTYRSRDLGVSIRQAILMFVLCMILPFLVSKLFGWINKI